jgi:hypothetical protein
VRYFFLMPENAATEAEPDEQHAAAVALEFK